MRNNAFTASLIVLALASTTLASPIVNGDFSNAAQGWTQWQAPWTSGGTAYNTDAGKGELSFSVDHAGQFGWFQRVAVEPSNVYTLVGDWEGDVGVSGWAGILMFGCTEAMTDQEIVDRILASAPADIVVTKDSFGTNLPMGGPWSWEFEPISGAATNSLDIHATCTEIVVALELLTVGGDAPHVSFDNLALVPEPTTALLMCLGCLLIRRRRAQAMGIS